MTKAQIAHSLKTYFLPLFDAETSVVTVTSAAGKADEIAAAFSKLGFEVEKRELPSLGAADDDGSDSEMGSGSESGSGSGSESGSEDGSERESGDESGSEDGSASMR